MKGRSGGAEPGSGDRGPESAALGKEGKAMWKNLWHVLRTWFRGSKSGDAKEAAAGVPRKYRDPLLNYTQSCTRPITSTEWSRRE